MNTLTLRYSKGKCLFDSEDDVKRFKLKDENRKIRRSSKRRISQDVSKKKDAAQPFNSRTSFHSSNRHIHLSLAHWAVMVPDQNIIHF